VFGDGRPAHVGGAHEKQRSHDDQSQHVGGRCRQPGSFEVRQRYAVTRRAWTLRRRATNANPAPTATAPTAT
jgi:hypothetical protein